MIVVMRAPSQFLLAGFLSPSPASTLVLFGFAPHWGCYSFRCCVAHDCCLLKPTWATYAG